MNCLRVNDIDDRPKVLISRETHVRVHLIGHTLFEQTVVGPAHIEAHWDHMCQF
jgi:hypothetical protein